MFSEINSSSLSHCDHAGALRKGFAEGEARPRDLSPEEIRDSASISGSASAVVGNMPAPVKKRRTPLHDVSSTSEVELSTARDKKHGNPPSSPEKTGVVITGGVRKDLIQSFVGVNGETWNIGGQQWSPFNANDNYSNGAGHSKEVCLANIPHGVNTDDVAKKVVIRQLLGDGLTGEETGLMEKTLCRFSLDNLMLLSEYGVKFNVKKLHDMPENFDGFDIKERFMEGHRELVDGAMRAFIAQYPDMKNLDPAKMSLDEKRRFLAEEIIRRNQQIKIENGDFGIMTLVDSNNIGELSNMSRVSGTTFPTLSHPGAGVFFLRHRLSEGVVLHEAAHALDIVKNLERDPGGFKQMKEDHMVVTGSERDWGLGSHYDWFQARCKKYPQHTWSQYAMEGKAYEYAAEAVRLFLQNPGLLRSQDFEMYRFAQSFVSKREYPSVRFEHIKLDSRLKLHDRKNKRHLNTGTKLPARNYIPSQIPGKWPRG